MHVFYQFGNACKVHANMETFINICCDLWHVRSVFRYTAARWPYQRQIAKEIDQVQFRMTAALMRVERNPVEDDAEYFRRRAHLASFEARRQGKWSETWARDVLAIDGHFARNTSGKLWTSKLREWKGLQWLREARALRAPTLSIARRPFTSEAGATGTRLRPGIVHTRWHDGVAQARVRLGS